VAKILVLHIHAKRSGEKLDMSQNGIVHLNILDFLLRKKRLNAHINYQLAQLTEANGFYFRWLLF